MVTGARDDPGVKMAQLQFGSQPDSVRHIRNTRGTPLGETVWDEFDQLKTIILVYKMYYKEFGRAPCLDPTHTVRTKVANRTNPFCRPLATWMTFDRTGGEYLGLILCNYYVALCTIIF